MPSLHPTGVEIIDHVLGGIAPGLPCVLAGPSGAGRTVLCVQLAQAALTSGRIVTYICNEPVPFLIQQAATLGFDLEPTLRSGQLVLLELDTAIASIVRSQGLEEFVRAVRSEEPIASTLIVDPFTALTPEIHDEASLRRCARAFLTAASPMDIVLAVESERLALQNGLERALSELCGAFLRLHRNESGRRTLTVEKTRSGVGQADRVDFRIGNGGTSPILREVEPETGTPIAPAPQIALPSQRAPRSEPGEIPKERPLILVIDSDTRAREQVTKWLSGIYDVATAGDGFEAMTMLINEKPDLVILDLLMPRISGYELLTAFRRAVSIPRLVISERVTRPGDRIGPLVLGATDTLAKPLERFELMHKVDLLLRLPGPGPDHMDPADAETLFGSITNTRLVDATGFNARLNSACRFGERYGLTSSIISLAAQSGAELEQFIDVADDGLRFEDAIFVVSKRRAVLLLVATEAADAPTIVGRIRERVDAARGRAMRLSTSVRTAVPVDDDCDWAALFRIDSDRAETPPE